MFLIYTALPILALGYQEQACTTPVSSSYAFCDTSLPLESRLSDLISRIQSINATYSDFEVTGASVPSLGIPPTNWWTEALHGLGEYGSIVWKPPTPYATMFPMPSLTACSFNKSLFFSIGDAISTEGRAFYNVDHSGISFFSPNINPFRSPHWGRGQEVPGEDPTLCASYAVSFTRGLQGNDPRYLKSVATIKHMAGYDLEGFNGTDRFSYNAIISPSDLADYYSLPFQSGIQDGQAAGIMCSYTAINGTPSCANRALLNDTAREAWGFSGYVVADCKAVFEIWSGHRFTNSADATVGATVGAGLDAECGGVYAMLQPHMASAVADKSANYSDVLGMIRNLARVRMRLGHFDPPSGQPWVNITPASVCTPEHNDLSMSAALQGSALLKNGGGGPSSGGQKLPWDPSAVKKLAVVGPNAASTVAPRGNYAGVPCFKMIVSVLQGVTDRLGTSSPDSVVEYAEGCSISSNSTQGFPNATIAAAGADATLVVVGLDGTQEGEWQDRTSLALPGVQDALISMVCAAAAPKPCVVVVVTGGPCDLSAPAQNPNVTGILHVGYGGPWGGNATAALLFGDFSPSGRLTTTIYPSAFTANVSDWDMNLRPGPSLWPPGWNPGRTHMFYTGIPVYPFGWGLSYTHWRYSLTHAPPSTLPLSHTLIPQYLASSAAHAPAPPPPSEEPYTREPFHEASSLLAHLTPPIWGYPILNYTLEVTNTGTMEAAEVVLGFLEPPGRGHGGVPKQILFDFARVSLPPGGVATLQFSVHARFLTRVNGTSREFTTGLWKVRFGLETDSQHGYETLPATHTIVIV